MIHAWKRRPFCVFFCLLSVLILTAQLFGARDGVSGEREQLQKGAQGCPGIQEKDEINVTGRIRRITKRTDDEVLLLEYSRVEPETDTAAAFNCRYYVQAYIQQTDVAIAVGSRVQVKGKAAYPSAPTCPGQFDMVQYANQKSVLMNVTDAEVTDVIAAHTAGTFLQRISGFLADAYDRVLDETDSGAMQSITLGDRSAMDPALRQLFRDGGIAHILAISGLHINLVGMSIYKLLRSRRCSFIVSALTAGGLLLLYCEMTGRSSSAVRAVLMFVLWAVSQAVGRTPDIPTSLSASACVLLIAHPGSLRDGGFWMSFGCVGSMYLLTPFMKELLCYRDSGKIQDNIRGIFAASLAVTIGTLPVSCLFYYQFYPYAPLVNLLVLPFMSALVISGFAGACIGSVFPGAGVFAAAPCHYLLKLFTELCRIEKGIPGSIVVTGRPSVPQVAAYYALLALAMRCWSRHWTFGIESVPAVISGNGNVKFSKRVLSSMCLAGALCFLCLYAGPSLRLIFLDVGQGDCIIIQSGRSAVVIDGGSSSIQDIWQYRMEPCLKYYGIQRIDVWAATHGDGDHINGIEDCAAGYTGTLGGFGSGGITVRQFCVSSPGRSDPMLDSLYALWQEKGVQGAVVLPEDEWQGKNFSLRVLYPDRISASDNANENSLVLLLETEAFRKIQWHLLPGNQTEQFDTEEAEMPDGLINQGPLRVLLTGDLEKAGEEQFLKQWNNIGKIHILKLGHHGSRYATSESLLAACTPDAAIASCGRRNLYGHPSMYTIERLEAAHTALLRTDLQGSIIVEGQ